MKKVLGLWFVTSTCALLGCSKEQPKETPVPQPSASPQAATEAKVAAPVAPALKTPPKSLGALKAPADNPTTAAKVALGQKLFFDKALSVDG